MVAQPAGETSWKIEIDKSSPEPIYLQIAAAIKGLLESGAIPAASALPPEQILAKRFGVSRMTMRQANDVLEREGLIERQRGRGTFAVQKRLVKQEQETRSFSEEIRRRGGAPSSRLLSFKTTEASPALAAEFNIAPGDPIYVIERVRMADGIPMALESVQIPAQRCPNLERFNIVDYSLYQIFEEHYGIELARSEEEISAIVPRKIHRKTLALPANVAILLVKRKTTRATAGSLSWRWTLTAATFMSQWFSQCAAARVSRHRCSNYGAIVDLPCVNPELCGDGSSSIR